MDFDTPEQLLKIKNKIPNFNKMAPMIIIVAMLFFALSSSFYMVGPDEEAVIQRFGRYTRSTPPGLHMKLPFGIERATNIRIKHVFKEEFGFQTSKPGIRTQYQKDGSDAAHMLTGDLNIAVVEWIVQFRVKDAVKMLFNVRSPRKTIRDVTESVMRQIIGDRTVNEVLTEGRTEIEAEAKLLLQRILDEYESGIDIVTIKLQDVNPPDKVKASFNDVNEAKQEKEQMINRARQDYNRIIPQARGEALKTIQEAEGYAADRINRAKGEADRFAKIWNEYVEAKEVTRKRMYLETLQSVLGKAGKKYTLDSEQKTMLPFMFEGTEVPK